MTAYIARVDSDGCTHYQSRLTSTRYTIGLASRDNCFPLYREGEYMGHHSRSSALSQIEQLDRREMRRRKPIIA